MYLTDILPPPLMTDCINSVLHRAAARKGADASSTHGLHTLGQSPLMTYESQVCASLIAYA
jgi:hypothetical protein